MDKEKIREEWGYKGKPLQWRSGFDAALSELGDFLKDKTNGGSNIAAERVSDLLCCPKCKSKVIIYGSECYPKDGMILECSNLDCDMEIELKIDMRTDKLKEAMKAAWNILAA